MGAISYVTGARRAVAALLVAAGLPATAQVEIAPGWSLLHWGVEDGMPVGSINAMTQDDDGYLWLATMDGLVRFDGHHLQIYDSASHPGLDSNRLIRLERDDDAMWLLTENRHLLRYADGEFQRLGVEHGLPDERVTALKNANGRWWVGTRAGAAWWDGRRFQVLDQQRWPDHTNALVGHPDGTIWIASRNGRLGRWRDGRLEIVAELGEPIWALALDPVAGLWLGHHSGASRWHEGKLEPLTVLPKALRDVIRIEFAPDDSMYLHTSVTLFRLVDGRLEVLADPLHRSGSQPIVFSLPGSDEFVVNHGRELLQAGERIFSGPARINSLMADREHNVWVATAGDGLYRLRTNSLTHYLGHPELGSASVYPISTDTQGRIWVGTSGAGLFILDRDGQVLEAAAADQPMETVYSLLPPEVPDDAAWIGGLGLYRWQAGRFSQQGVPRDLARARIYALYRGRDGTVWAGTNRNGLWQLVGGNWQQVRLPGELIGARVRVLLEDRNGTIWMGTNGDGLLRRNGNDFERIDPSRGLPSLLVRALHLDPDGRLWIGTETHGLCRIVNPADPLDALMISCLDRSHGLFHHGIHQVLEDQAGHLWLSSNIGIFRADRSILEEALEAVAAGRDGPLIGPTDFVDVDGLPNREANGGVQSAGTVGPDGRLWFPTMSGPVAIDPAGLEPHQIEPIVLITGIGAGNRVWSPNRSRLELPARPGDINFSFTAPSFVSPRNLQFEYRLRDHEQAWRGPTDHRKVEYINLPHGEYSFEVRARVGSAAAGPIAEQLLRIPPRLIERASFQAIAALVLLGMAAFVWRRRDKRNKADRVRLQNMVASRTAEINEQKFQAELARDEITRQAERLRTLDREKRDFFANISHELRTPLTMLLGPLDQFRDSPQRLAEQAPLMHRNARRLNRLVEQLLDLQRIEGGQLRISPELHDLVAWAASLVDLFRPLADQRRIEIRLERPEEGLLAWFDRGQMEKVLGNLLSNAIRYCRAGDRVCIELARDDETARIRMEDTGPGIPAGHLPNLFERFYRATEPDSPIEGTGIGLALSRDLIQLHGGDIAVESEPGTGTTFTLHWPARATDGHLHRNRDRIRHDRIADREVAQTEDGTEQQLRKLLLVDDNPDIREWLGRSLSGEFSVVTANDGVEALQRIDEALPDLVISDWMMPNMDGIELLEEMEKRADCAGLPVIMLTARGDIGDRIGAYHAGAVAYVAKPFNLDVLRAQIDSILEQQQRLRKRLAEEGAAGRLEVPEEAVESKFARQTSEAIDRNMHDPGFGVEQLAAEMNMDRSVLFRRVREEFSITPSELLRDRRLQVARDLMQRREGSVSEVAYAVGFGSVDGFSRAFQRKYGTSPSRVDTAPARPATASTD
ncbi:MAG: hypothetical protein CMP07_01950 [Xanthomonadales bacterium]|nr:hypothetical protein [Xanthomonadales bacterium]